MATRLITVQQAVSQASQEIGIAQRPVSQAIGSLDQDISQMVALLSAVADELLTDDPYRQALGDGYWLLATDGTPRQVPQADTDLILFDGRLAVSGLKFRFLQAKGLESGEPHRDFTVRLNKVAVEANRRVLDLDADAERIQ
jgi:hypothetical protein